MSILYDEAQSAIRFEAERILKARHAPEHLLELLEATGQYDVRFWRTCVEQGWTGIATPESYRGFGLGLLELGLVAEACGQTTIGAPFLTTSLGVSHGLDVYGDTAQKATWLPRLATGEAVGAIAFAEGPTPLPCAPMARFANGRLNGKKPFVTAGLNANIALALAESDQGLALVLVDLAMGGVERNARSTFDNSRVVADLVFNDARGALLASGPQAHHAALDILSVQAVVTAHEQVGGAQACLDRARAYSLERRAFGQPIAAFQSIKHRLAELYVLVELARANTIHAAAEFRQAGFLKAAAAARLSATEAYDACTREATQIHGGIGVTWEAALHLHQRRSRALGLEQGNSLFWEDLLADLILTERREA